MWPFPCTRPSQLPAPAARRGGLLPFPLAVLFCCRRLFPGPDGPGRTAVQARPRLPRTLVLVDGCPRRGEVIADIQGLSPPHPRPPQARTSPLLCSYRSLSHNLQRCAWRWPIPTHCASFQLVVSRRAAEAATLPRKECIPDKLRQQDALQRRGMCVDRRQALPAFQMHMTAGVAFGVFYIVPGLALQPHARASRSGQTLETSNGSGSHLFNSRYRSKVFQTHRSKVAHIGPSSVLQPKHQLHCLSQLACCTAYRPAAALPSRQMHHPKSGGHQSVVPQASPVVSTYRTLHDARGRDSWMLPDDAGRHVFAPGRRSVRCLANDHNFDFGQHTDRQG